jgi:DNA transformation protein
MPAKTDPHRFNDLFAAFGPITLRRMFGGEGLFVKGQIIGLVMQDRIFFKTDDTTRPDYVAERCKPFDFVKGGKRIETSYFAIPERLYDEPEELADWARKAHGIARAKPKRKK